MVTGQPHVVAVPCPFHGHITPFMQLCELLARNGITVTVVATERFEERVRKDIHSILGRRDTNTSSDNKNQKLQRLKTSSSWLFPNEDMKESPMDMRVALLPDGLPPDYQVGVVNLPNYLRHVEKLGQPLLALLQRLGSSPPPISCLLSDTHLGWVQDVADVLHVPRVCFLTSSTTEFSVLFHQPMLLSLGLLPFKEGCDTMSCIPGLPATHKSDFPSFLQVGDPCDFEFQYFMRQIGRTAEADRVLVASFDSLEHSAIQGLSNKLNIKPIGPLAMVSDAGDDDVANESWMHWLDAQETRSVIYVAFGTLANLQQNEVNAIAGALDQSKRPFIWALRNDIVAGMTDPLPRRFKERALSEGRGFVLPWAPQRRILQHRAVAAFLTHSGWGSTLESICYGVPLLCWPLYGDQLLNCNLMTEGWNAGVQIAPTRLDDRRRLLQAFHVNEAIERVTKTPLYHSNMLKLQELAQKAWCEEGSSKQNMQKLVEDLFNGFSTSTMPPR